MKRKHRVRGPLAIALTLALSLPLSVPVSAWADDEASAPEQTAIGEVSEFSSGASAAVWDGSERADSFAAGDGTQAAPYEISSAAQLAYLAQAVNAGDAFTQKHFKLTASIDLNGQAWTPIGTSGRPFSGTFDGNGETISNLMINDPALTGAGLFGFVASGAVKNLTVSNASVTAAAEAGALAGSAYTGSVENCKVVGAIKIQGNYKVGGLAGEGYAEVVGCSVEGAAGSYVKGVWTTGNNLEGDNVGGLLGFTGEGAPNDRIRSCRVSGLEVSGTRKVGGLLGYLHHSASVSDSVVDNVTVTCDLTGNPDYLDGNDDSSGIGGLVGVVHGQDGASTSAGSMTDCTVSNVKLVTEGTRSMAGYLYGKLRITAELPTTSNCMAVNCTGSTVALDGTAHKGNDGESAAAQIGQDGSAQVYSTLQDAFDAAQPGDTVKLLKDVSENVVVKSGTDVVLDLSGKVVSGVAFEGVYCDSTVVVEGALTVRDGTASQAPQVSADYRSVSYAAGKILGKSPTDKKDQVFPKALLVQNGGSAVIESGIVESEDSDAAFVTAGSSLKVSGGYIHSAEFGIGVQGEGAVLEMTDGVVVADNNAAIGGNGNDTADDRDTSIAISGGTIVSHIETPGYIACGIYHPQRGSLRITGGTVYADGGVGILMRGGTLEMTEGSVVATGTTSGKVGDSTVVQNCYGIQIDGASGYYDHENTKVSVSGGSVKAAAGVPALSEVDATGRITVSGGAFSTDVSAYFDSAVFAQNAPNASERPGAVVPRAYSISYDLAGGSLPSGASNPVSYTYFDEVILSNPTKAGYVFAGWTGTGLAAPTTQASIAKNSTGDRSYTATWKLVPLPDAEVEIQIEVPQPVEGAPVSASVPDESTKAAARSAQSALGKIQAGVAPAGMSEQEAREVGDLIAGAQKGETVSVVVSLGFAHKPHEVVEESERGAIEGVAADGEEVALFLELSVKMTVKVAGADGSVKNERTVELGEVDEPLLFEVHVDPALIQGKSVRIAHVHDGATEIIYPESVDRDRGIIMLRADRFSTYALLTSETCTVGFESNGGTAVEPQTVKFGEKAAKPADPERTGYAFAGWYADEALSKAYDFSQPVEGFMTLYAKWTALSGGSVEGAGAKPLPEANPAKPLASTGDGAGLMAFGAAALAAVAGGALAASRRRRSR